MRFLINFSYDGSGYSGFQIQPNLDTIQKRIEDAICKINNGIYKSIHVAGRTDKGVHALNQWAHVDLDININEYKLKRALNSNLPDDIYIKNAYIVDNKFHTRYCVKEKEYKYYINIGDYNPIERNYIFQYNYSLDINAMKEAIKVFLGEHDFRAFVTDGKDKTNCIRKITDAYIEQNDKYIIITFRGNGFLRYQVRNMVGILLKVGQNKLSKSELLNILESKERGKNGVTAPSNGLYLMEIKFKDDKYS